MRNRLILCVGVRGSGKSTVASSILKPNDGIFVFDPHGDEVYRFIYDHRLIVLKNSRNGAL